METHSHFESKSSRWSGVEEDARVSCPQDHRYLVEYPDTSYDTRTDTVEVFFELGHVPANHLWVTDADPDRVRAGS